MYNQTNTENRPKPHLGLLDQLTGGEASPTATELQVAL
jgi:hypothetical protein